jgi:hypothetical protein
MCIQRCMFPKFFGKARIRVGVGIVSVSLVFSLLPAIKKRGERESGGLMRCCARKWVVWGRCIWARHRFPLAHIHMSSLPICTITRGFHQRMMATSTLEN